MRPVPRFSVVVPTFDRGRLVAEAVRSALEQTCADREVLVVDDGSTDDTRERLAPFAPDVRYLHQPHRGASAARNLGIREARGELVGFLDSDDRWEPDTLATVARIFDTRPDVGLVSFRCREIEADGTRTERIFGKRSPGESYTTADLIGIDAGGCSWFVARRDLLLEAGGFDESLPSAEECDLVVRLSFATRFHGTPEPLLLRRIHGANLSGDKERNARGWIALLEKLAREHPEFVATHRADYRRALGKERLRLGRERLARAGVDPTALAEARSALAASVATYPWFLRTPAYLAWAWLAPRAYARWRRAELRWKQRRARS